MRDIPGTKRPMTSNDQPQRPNAVCVSDTHVSADGEKRQSNCSMPVPYRRPAANHSALPTSDAVTIARTSRTGSIAPEATRAPAMSAVGIIGNGTPSSCSRVLTATIQNACCPTKGAGSGIIEGPVSSDRQGVRGPIDGAATRDQRGRLITRVKDARAFESRNQRRLCGGHAPAGAPRKHEVVGQSVEDVERRDSAVGEAGQIDRTRARVHERRPKPGTPVAAADATRPAVAAVLDGQVRFGHRARRPRGKMRDPRAEVSAAAMSNAYQAAACRVSDVVLLLRFRQEREPGRPGRYLGAGWVCSMRARLVASSRADSGFLRTSSAPALYARLVTIPPTLPLTSAIGTERRMPRTAWMKVEPDIPGIRSSVITALNPPGSARNASSAAVLDVKPTGA